jgi:phosphoribosylformylglycinamidine synthase PurS subunit
MTRTFKVTITRKPGLSDPEGATSHKALTDLGFTEVSGVSFGRIIIVTLDTADATDGEAMDRVRDMCSKLLANPVIEDHTVEEIS